MNHIDLFSGIGGFACAARQVWQEEYNNICFCEIDQFCQKVLKKNFGEDILIYDDIRTLSKERLIADTESRQSGEQTESEGGEDSCGRSIKIDLLTGGFPCQPFSAAGQRRGKEDDRYLWPEMLRVIKELKPTWIIGGNVAGIINMAQQQSESDMESENDFEGNGDDNGRAEGIIWEIINDIEQAGYSVQPFVIPACAVNAPHRRDRVWIVGYSEGTGKTKKREILAERTGNKESADPIGDDKPTERPTWGGPWLEVATELCRMDDGVSPELYKLETSDRVARLKALGNAIVPQVVMPIMKAIKKSQ